MTVYIADRIIKHSRETIFDLLADVERYPSFLPMWKAARIIRRDGNVYTTEQVVGFGVIRERFRTQTKLERPERIAVSSTDGLFRKFLIHWALEAVDDKSCRVEIELNWEVRSRILQKAIDLILPDTAETMIDAFERQADRDEARRP